MFDLYIIAYTNISYKVSLYSFKLTDMRCMDKILFCLSVFSRNLIPESSNLHVAEGGEAVSNQTIE